MARETSGNEAVTEDTFLELLEHLAAAYGDRKALRWDPSDTGVFMTYADLLASVRSRAAELSAKYADTPEEGRIYVIGRMPLTDWIVEMFASAAAGLQTILADPSVPQERIAHIVNGGGPVYPGCLLFFTSGTTDTGKAVVLSQRALIRSAWNGQQMCPCYKDDRLLCTLPLTHVFGFVCSFMWPLTQGAEIDLFTGMRGLMTDAKAYEPTIISVVPSLLDFLMKAQALNSSLRLILVGAGPLTREAVMAVLNLGIHVRFGYGLTETASGLAISMDDNDPYGMALCPDTEMQLGEDDEIFVRTTCMMECYYHDPAATARKLDADGWLATGDIGRFDENGNIHILGRLNDVIVMPNGEKIYLPEAEASLGRDLGCECALTLDGGKLTLIAGIPDEITADNNRTELEEWKARITSGLDTWNLSRPAARRVMKIRFRNGTFPRTMTGKLQRYKL